MSLRPLRRVAAALAVSALLAGPAAAAEPLVPGFADVPLMPGLSPLAEGAVAFDSPGGRIVVAYARGAVPADRMRAFYAQALPQLGWRGAGGDVWRREGESLRIEALSPAPLTVRFTLAPAR